MGGSGASHRKIEQLVHGKNAREQRDPSGHLPPDRNGGSAKQSDSRAAVDTDRAVN
jgi:hypothetical protein